MNTGSLSTMMVPSRSREAPWRSTTSCRRRSGSSACRCNNRDTSPARTRSAEGTSGGTCIAAGRSRRYLPPRGLGGSRDRWEWEPNWVGRTNALDNLFSVKAKFSSATAHNTWNRTSKLGKYRTQIVPYVLTLFEYFRKYFTWFYWKEQQMIREYATFVDFRYLSQQYSH